VDGRPQHPYRGVLGVDQVAEQAERRPRPPAAPALLAPRTGDRLVVPDVVLPDGLAALVRAATRVEAAGACLPLLAELPGVRGTAVVGRDRHRVVVLASVGYGCGPMAAGAELPLDASLPVTEAVRTGRTVVQGDGPSWVAVPFSRGAAGRGALLLSLTVGPPAGPAELARLQRLAGAVGDALARTGAAEDDRAAVAALVEALRPPPPRPVPGWEVVVRSRGADGPAGGDVVGCLPDGGGGAWLVAADVMGSGLAAALPAHAVRTALGLLARSAPGPVALLTALEDAVVPALPAGCFVTALAVHAAADGTLRAASAGHPPPLLLDGVAGPLEVEPGPPLGVEGGPRPEASGRLPRGAVLLLHTDGLVERRTPLGVELLEAAGLATCSAADLEAAADAVLRAADAVAPATDDVSVLLARPLA
jgi:hypothetical protein